jgi:hypothetical protein
MHRSRILAVAVVGAFAISACNDKGAQPEGTVQLRVLVKVTGDPDQAVKGAKVLYTGKPIATTDEKGLAKLDLTGREGDSYAVTISCPQGYTSPTKGETITVRRQTDPSKLPEYDVTCEPSSRTVVVTVRADNGANLPVLYLGREVARTDSSGAAHVLLKDVKRDDSVALTISTAGKGQEDLRPQNPTANFTIKGQDDVFLFDQPFTLEKKKAKAVWRPSGPKKI